VNREEKQRIEDMRLLREARERLSEMDYKKKKDLRGSGHARVKVTLQDTGFIKKIRIKKSTPHKCSTPRRVCITCKKNVIHKLSKYYDSRICENCQSP
jgi:hypothetical protein